MPETAHPEETGEREPIRVPDSHLEGIEASVRKLMEQSAQQARQLDDLASAPTPLPPPFAAFGMPGSGGSAPAVLPQPRPILELEGESYEDELDALSDWVDDFLLPVYGAEVTTAAPWCLQWQEHHDVVAWLHALWLAYQQHKDPETGLSGMLVWHRDFLAHAIAAIRGPGGPLSACMTSPDRPSHRLLPGPKPSARTADRLDGTGGDLDMAA
ncbi:DUF4913 domain-containing protein [Streptomyces venezuelae]|uniref:DUF4913 domain-containing protein n=2 Tax=Streptomyces TaxID=1883 RepID=A0A5P2ALI5_STRVZ|nr:DUF4913 domain-containing protein [Streptomyces venezuelae]